MNSTETQTVSTPVSAVDSHSALLAPHKDVAERQADPARAEDEEFLLVPPLATLPAQLDVCIPLPAFRVADLVALEPGRVLASTWGCTDDVPLWCGQVQLVWAEFEVVDQKIAVRVTRLI